MSNQIEFKFAKSAILADKGEGRAILTFVLSNSSRFTYRITKKDSIYWVSLLNGPNNTKNYIYIGTITSQLNFRHTTKSKVGIDAPGFVAFDTVFQKVIRGIDDKTFQIWGSGDCCRCGRTLTDPLSISRGIGPECFKMS